MWRMQYNAQTSHRGAQTTQPLGDFGTYGKVQKISCNFEADYICITIRRNNLSQMYVPLILEINS